MKVRIEDIKVGERFREDFGDIEGLAASLRQYGLIEPIVIDRDMNLISGERRLRAAKLLGWTEIEAVFRDETDELTRRELELEENLQRKQMTWQEEVKLKAEIHRLKQQRYGVAKPGRGGGKGWSLRDTAQALGQSLGAVSMDIELAEAIEVVPELAKERSKQQALRKWKRLKERAIMKELARRAVERGERPVEGALHGDCVALMRQMADESVDCVVTDPPWGIGITERFTGRRNVVDYTDSEYETVEMLNAAFREMYRVLRPNTHAYIFYDIKQHNFIIDMLEKAGFTVDPIPLIWVKNVHTTVPSGMSYASQYEAILFCQKGRRQLNGTPTNVLTFPAVPPRERIHISQKPVALLRELIEQSTVPGETVLDPFAGSGSTAIAAWQARRRFIVIEKDDASYAAMVTRIAEETAEGEVTDGDASK